MAERRPLILLNGEVQELPSGDSLPVSNGLPSGGTANQVLAKASSTDYDASFVDASVPLAAAVGSTNTISVGAESVTKTNLRGNIGIGTTSQTQLLDVGGFGAPISYGGSTTYGRLGIADNVNGLSGAQMYNASTGTAADFRFSVFDTDKLHYLAFAMPGKNNSLTLFGQSRSSIATIFNNTLSGGTARNLVIGTVSAASLMFGTSNALRATITSSGQVGIGTSTPSCQLHVEGAIRSKSYTVATVPSASTSGAGAMIYVTDAAAGANLFISDGTNWRDAARNLLA